MIIQKNIYDIVIVYSVKNNINIKENDIVDRITNLILTSLKKEEVSILDTTFFFRNKQLSYKTFCQYESFYCIFRIKSYNINADSKQIFWESLKSELYFDKFKIVKLDKIFENYKISNAVSLNINDKK